MTAISRALVGACLCAVAACAASRREPPAAPSIDRPSSAIPGDLDLAFRVDLARVRAVFGPHAVRALRLDVVDAGKDPGTAKLLDAALERGDTLWGGLRPGLAAELTDNVLAVRGSFGGLEPDARSGFLRPRDLGGAWLVYDRPHPARRSAPARIYLRSPDRLVFVSEAEIDSTERVVELGADDGQLHPPDRGIVSLSARPASLAALLEERFPAVAGAIEGATLLDAFADAGASGLEAEVSLRFPGAEDAAGARERAVTLFSALEKAPGVLGLVGKGTRAEAIGSSLVVRLALPAEGLNAVLGCLGGAGGC